MLGDREDPDPLDDPDYCKLSKLATKTRSSRNLRQLRRTLVAFDEFARECHDERYMMSSDDDPGFNAEATFVEFGLDPLPTFGGRKPRNTSSVRSWDADNLLIGNGPCRNWRIIKRKASARSALAMKFAIGDRVRVQFGDKRGNYYYGVIVGHVAYIASGIKAVKAEIRYAIDFDDGESLIIPARQINDIRDRDRV
jgi:hypothetical protein